MDYGIGGTHIRRLRTAKHMTQEELAEQLYITRQAVSAWETGKALPDVPRLWERMYRRSSTERKASRTWRH